MTVARFATAVALAALAACGSQDATPPATAGDAAAPAAAPAPTGAVIELKAITDDAGNRFEPTSITAKPGDVIRLTLVSGVHNLSFPADRNPAGVTLPPATELLQLPGQTVDVPVPTTPGSYYFQCDPHAALGMTGTLEVVP